MRKGGEGRQSAEALGDHLLMASGVMGLVKPYLSGNLGHCTALASRHMRFDLSPRLEFESVPESGQKTICWPVLSHLTSIHPRVRMYPAAGLSFYYALIYACVIFHKRLAFYHILDLPPEFPTDVWGGDRDGVCAEQ